MRLYLFELVQSHNSKSRTCEKTNRPIAVVTFPRRHIQGKEEILQGKCTIGRCVRACVRACVRVCLLLAA